MRTLETECIRSNPGGNPGLGTKTLALHQVTAYDTKETLLPTKTPARFLSPGAYRRLRASRWPPNYY
ncbi:hypothetical protein [Candidatus Methylacidithermus pantelleriae]|uniref:hypothetical protein n=1 Tax=Candidatus Methylacidithermus pantelleriae TaxID=2744239 RepID=UPI00157D663F|nr:hypothetical protein [Candidatus Methylacidithermus pantelleriae]